MEARRFKHIYEQHLKNIRRFTRYYNNIPEDKSLLMYARTVLAIRVMIDNEKRLAAIWKEIYQTVEESCKKS